MGCCATKRKKLTVKIRMGGGLRRIRVEWNDDNCIDYMSGSCSLYVSEWLITSLSVMSFRVSAYSSQTSIHMECFSVIFMKSFCSCSKNTELFITDKISDYLDYHEHYFNRNFYCVHKHMQKRNNRWPFSQIYSQIKIKLAVCFPSAANHKCRSANVLIFTSGKDV